MKIMILICAFSILSGVLDMPDPTIKFKYVDMIDDQLDMVLEDVVNGRNVDAVKKLARLDNFIEELRSIAQMDALRKQYK